VAEVSKPVKLAVSLAYQWNTKIFTSQEPFWPTALLSRPHETAYGIRYTTIVSKSFAHFIIIQSTKTNIRSFKS